MSDPPHCRAQLQDDETTKDSRSKDGEPWVEDAKLRRMNVEHASRIAGVGVENTYQGNDYGWDSRVGGEPWSNYEGDKGRITEKLTVPEFDGEGTNDYDLGKSARSYLRKVQVWLQFTKLGPSQRGLALYNALSGRAWIYGEELDVHRLGTPDGVAYFLRWVQSRFMEVEVSRVAQLMTDLFRRCKKKNEQSVRDFNIEFERMVLRLGEVQCQVPPVMKAWLYLDKLRLSESEELALLSSVGNDFDCQRLQQAALLQDRSTRRPSTSQDEHRQGHKRWGRQSVHMTEIAEASSSDEASDVDQEDVLMDEDTANDFYTAYMTFQGAKSKYKEVLKGRGTDKSALEAKSKERLRLAKQRSYCSACKRRGHWHKDPECPMRQRSSTASTPSSTTTKGDAVNSVNFVHQCYMTDEVFGNRGGHLGRDLQRAEIEDLDGDLRDITNAW